MKLKNGNLSIGFEYFLTNFRATQECWVQNHWLAVMLTQTFIFPKSIKWVPGTSGDVVVKSKLSPRSGSVALKQLHPIHKKGMLASIPLMSKNLLKRFKTFFLC